MTTSQKNSELQKDIVEIDEKRQVLEEIVNIANAIENMQQSLEAVLVLGVSSKEMPRDAFDLYSALSANLRGLSVNQIKDYLKNLELIINNQLEEILRFSGVDCSSDDAIEVLYISSDSSQKNPFELVEEFKRTAQTAVSLKVLLKKRGVTTPGSTFDVPQSIISRQIKHLDAQEQTQRARIKTKIEEMKDDISNMIDNPGYPDSMKEMLINVKKDLDNDLSKIESGQPLGGLNFSIDTEEIIGVEASPIDDSKSDDLTGEKKNVGFAEAANRWLNSSWDVSWKEAKESE